MANTQKIQVLVPTEAEIRSVLAHATRAPSGDNCQPFRFEWDGECLSIHQNEARAQHYFNYQNHASYLALGLLLEAISIAASHGGYSIQCELNDWANIHFNPTHSPPPFSLEALEMRYTDRRSFLPSIFSLKLRRTLLEDTDRNETFKMYVLDTLPDHLTEYLALTERIAFENPTAHSDLHKWLRFSRSASLDTRDGMPWQSLGVSYLESRVLKWGKHWSLQSLLNKAGFLSLLSQNHMKNIRSSTGSILFTTQRRDKSSLVDIGRQAMRAWLTLNSQGYGVQPLTSGSLLVYDSLAHAYHRSQDPAFFQRGYALFTQAFSLSKEELPVWMLRFGKAQPRINGSKTLRLEMDDIFRVK